MELQSDRSNKIWLITCCRLTQIIVKVIEHIVASLKVKDKLLILIDPFNMYPWVNTCSSSRRSGTQYRKCRLSASEADSSKASLASLNIHWSSRTNCLVAFTWWISTSWRWKMSLSMKRPAPCTFIPVHENKLHPLFYSYFLKDNSIRLWIYKDTRNSEVVRERTQHALKNLWMCQYVKVWCIMWQIHSKNEALSSLRKKTTNLVHTLTHVREKLQHVVQETKVPT